MSTILGITGPGKKAAKLHQVKAPLVDAGLTKAEIREIVAAGEFVCLGSSRGSVLEFTDSVRHASYY